MTILPAPPVSKFMHLVSIYLVCLCHQTESPVARCSEYAGSQSSPNTFVRQHSTEFNHSLIWPSGFFTQAGRATRQDQYDPKDMHQADLPSSSSVSWARLSSERNISTESPFSVPWSILVFCAAFSSSSLIFAFFGDEGIGISVSASVTSSVSACWRFADMVSVVNGADVVILLSALSLACSLRCSSTCLCGQLSDENGTQVAVRRKAESGDVDVCLIVKHQNQGARTTLTKDEGHDMTQKGQETYADRQSIYHSMIVSPIRGQHLGCSPSRVNIVSRRAGDNGTKPYAHASYTPSTLYDIDTFMPTLRNM